MSIETLYKTIEIAHGDMCYHFYSGGDELIFLIHGIGCNKASFKHIWEANEFKEYTLLAVDLMGYGSSQAPEDFSYDMNDQAAACFELIQSLDCKKIHVVAHSMGGAVGILLSKMIENSKLDLLSFTSIEGNFIASDCGLISRKMIDMDFEFFRDRHFDYLKKSSSNSKDKGVKEWSIQLKTASEIGFYRSAYSLVKWSDSGELLNEFNQINARKAYIYGENTGELEVLEYLNDNICYKIKKSGHFIMVEEPDAFHEVLIGIVQDTA